MVSLWLMPRTVDGFDDEIRQLCRRAACSTGISMPDRDNAADRTATPPVAPDVGKPAAELFQ